MNRRTIRVAAVIFGAGLALAVPTTLAYADGHDVVPGSACSHIGAGGWHHQSRYECRLVKPGCKLWKFDDTITGDWTGGPAHCPKCGPKPSHSHTPKPSGSPSPSESPSATPTATESPTATATPSDNGSTAGEPTPTETPAGDVPTDTLPVTGPGLGAIYLGVLGLALVTVGGVAVWVARRRTT